MEAKKKISTRFFASFVRSKFRNWHFDKYLGRTSSVPSFYSGLFTSAFSSHRGMTSQKWIQFLGMYDKIVFDLKTSFGNEVSILEIGVQRGGSIQIWREIFGSQARIVGVDIDEKCATLNLDAEIYIGDSSDKSFLNSLQRKNKPFNLIVDDGSHNSKHQKKAFESLFPLLSNDGIYVVEDLEHSYYWSKHGGYFRSSSFISSIKRLIDQMHRQYFLSPAFRGFKVDGKTITSITICPGMAVFRKGSPVESRIIESPIKHLCD